MSANTQIPKTKDVLKYMLLPGILPRAKELGGTGFGYLAFLFAQIYQAVRILPPNHPYTNAANIGTFTLLQVLAASANNIKFNRQNIDQIVVFFLLIGAVILVALQFVLLILGLFTGHAFAATGGTAPSLTSMFITPQPASDVAFLMLDYVFGIPASTGGGAGPAAGWFGSSAGTTTAFHSGMHALFKFYNSAILLIGVLIFMYYVIVVVIETAQTGVPFGRRFSKIYAPMRLVFAIGLLIPLGYGFNASQYIVLYAAKWGSSFATNGWTIYNRALQNPLGVNNNSLVARPSAPSIDEMVYFSSVYHACREMYAIWAPRDYLAENQRGICISSYVIINGQAREFTPNGSSVCTGAGSTPAPAGGAAGGDGTYSYQQAKTDFRNTDIEVVLGEYNTTKNRTYAGGVRPFCGKITLSLSNENPSIYNNGNGNNNQTPTAVRAVESMYYSTVQKLLKVDSPTPFAAFGERAARVGVPQRRNGSLGGAGNSANAANQARCHQSGLLRDAASCNTIWKPPAASFQDMIGTIRSDHSAELGRAYNAFRDGLSLKLGDTLEKRGWGGAGIWYNNIADLNGVFTGAAYAVPTVRKFPEVMEFVKRQRQEADKAIGLCDTFSPNLGDNQMVRFPKPNESNIADTLNTTYKYFNCERPNQETGGNSAGVAGALGSTGTGAGNGSGACGEALMLSQGGSARGLTSNVFVDVISLVFGLNGLFDIRACSAADEATGQPRVHPLAQLSTVGKSLVENSIRSMAMAIGASFGGGMLGVLGTALGPALQSASGMFVGIATIGLTAGFVLYYILPFLPFIYFFFAVGSWVKSIFEAMVGAPLWALAHLKIDGEGFSGRAAAAGYWLILEIFLRPIVTVFGLIGGMAIFGALAITLNNLFDLVVINVTGDTPGAGAGSTITMSEIESLRRGIVDQFFFTIMYAILMYMMATSSFKMIDNVPKNFMRWIGAGVTTFNDNKSDPTQHLTQYAAAGGAQMSSQILGAANKASGAAGQLGATLGASLTGGGATPRGGRGR